MKLSTSFLLFFAVLVAFLALSDALIHSLHLRHDKRAKFFIENFGFEEAGVINIFVKNFNGTTDGNKGEAGFVIEKTQTDATRFVDESDDINCMALKNDHFQIDKENQNFTYIIKKDMAGFYNIFYISCHEESVSFDLRLELYNNAGDDDQRLYLSAGQLPLTVIYPLLAVAYVVTLIVWVFLAIRGTGNKVFLIHHLMTALFVLETLSIIFKGFDLHYLNKNGHAGGWAASYYTFSFLKGVTMFIVIALVGTGWTFIKPFLSDKDKKIFLVVIPLQILDNIALVIIEETAPGFKGWFTWKDIFRLVDIVCCGAILVPIIWSIKHLKEASEVDGKAAKNMEKLVLFRQFYLIVVSYVYFTRIIIYLLDATLPFRWVFLGDLFTELATYALFTIIGYKFRPIPNNPFLTLDDDDVPRSANSINNSDHNEKSESQSV